MRSVVDMCCCYVVSMQMLHVMVMCDVAVVWVLCSVGAVLLLCVQNANTACDVDVCCCCSVGAVLLMFAVAVCAEC